MPPSLFPAIALLAALGCGASLAQDAPPKAQPALTVTTTTAQRTELTTHFSANGNIAAWQEASIGAEIGGLRIAEVLVNVGDVVRKGQVLARFATDLVQGDVAQARAALQQAEAAVAEARANAERARALAGSGAMSQQQIQQYATAEQSALASVASAKAQLGTQQLRLAHTEVRAPDAGVVSARSATVGAVVGAGTELFRMVRQGRLEWRAEVGAADLALLSPGVRALVGTAGGGQVQGKVRMLGPTVDVNTRNALVYVDLPADPRLRAGMYASGRFVLGDRQALTVPLSAVVVRDGFPSVFELQGSDHVILRRVHTGQRTGERIEVTEGLAEGAHIVQRGGTFLNDGDLVRVVQESEQNPAQTPASQAPAATKTK
ncbi:efflux RND transporter periplasmic adaptor subunit [Comamonas flocculans]|uniref:Efflux RND transporter periplasmic adaptor subunit n=1 Tax=Comamonas flocculans TaxID=2597701 RepID=A0A5B8RSU3_9BURK|nr:efflux RND transporter periplasmic adaptor subunit [Comamonas flocculans]QEA12729.1 efflux RND transporter periplasmic adaptor subunit [Comamonas flocculans]